MSGHRVPFRRTHTGSFAGDQMQRVAQQVAQAVNAQPLAGAKLIDAESGAFAGTGLAFSAGTARSIAHGLGRRAVGFFETYGLDTASAARVGLFPTAHPAGITSDTHVTVTPTSSGTCWLVVF